MRIWVYVYFLVLTVFSQPVNAATVTFHITDDGTNTTLNVSGSLNLSLLTLFGNGVGALPILDPLDSSTGGIDRAAAGDNVASATNSLFLSSTVFPAYGSVDTFSLRALSGTGDYVGLTSVSNVVGGGIDLRLDSAVSTSLTNYVFNSQAIFPGTIDSIGLTRLSVSALTTTFAGVPTGDRVNFIVGDLAPVPVPGAVWLFGTGLAVLVGWRRWSMKSA